MRQLIVAAIICAYPGVLFLIFLALEPWAERERQRKREEAETL